MSQMKPNPSIRCRVSSCAYNCGDKECCSLQAIQVEPCGGIYQLGSPIVEEASIALPGDKTFTIRTHGGSAKAIYVKKYVLNGKQLKEPHITHKQIMEGGTLDVYMTEK